MTNVMVVDNTAYHNIIEIVDSDTTIESCTIAGNEAWWGINSWDEDADPDSLTIHNTILWNDSPYDLGYDHQHLPDVTYTNAKE